MTPSKGVNLPKRRNTIHESHPAVTENLLAINIKQRCAVSGCQFVEGAAALFPLPIQVISNRHLSMKWCSILKFDQPLTKYTLLCERHFDRKFISTSIFTGKPKLDPSAIPSRTFGTIFPGNVRKEVAIVQPVVKSDGKRVRKRKIELDNLDDHSSSVPPKKSIKLRFLSENDGKSKAELPYYGSSSEDYTSDESCSSASSYESKRKGEHRNCKGHCSHNEASSSLSSSRSGLVKNSLMKIRTPDLSDESSSTLDNKIQTRTVDESDNSNKCPPVIKNEVHVEPFKRNSSMPVDYNDDNASDVFQSNQR